MSNEERKFSQIMHYISIGRNREAQAIIQTIENRSELVEHFGLQLVGQSIITDNTEMLEYLIRSEGCSMDKLKYGCTILTLAVITSKPRMVEILINNNADIYQPSYQPHELDGKSTLEVAFFRRLHPAPSSRQSLHNLTNLDLILKMLFDKVNDDFSKGTSTQSLTNASDSLKLAIVIYGNANVARFILQNGFPIDFHERKQGYTALHCAIRLARFENAKILIEHGANVDALDKKECSPLNYYLSHFEDVDEESEILKSFLKHSNRLSTLRESDNYTLVESLLKCGKKVTVKTVLLSDIKVDELINQDRTVSSLIVENENADVQNIFTELNDKIDVNKRTWNGFTALMSAALSGCPKRVECLLRHGADVNSTSSIGLSALSYALNAADYSKVNPDKERNVVKVVELLCQYGADVQCALKARPNLINTLSEKSKVIVAHLAMLEATDQSVITESTRNIIESTLLLKNYFDLCKHQLEKMKELKVHDTVTLFTLLTEKDEKIVVYAGNQELLTAWTNVMEHWTYYVSYYSNTLQRRLSRGLALSWRS